MATIGAGERAPALDTTLDDAEGVPHHLQSALQRGPIVLGVYKSSCQASKTMFPFLQRLADRYGAQGLSVFGVSQDSTNVTRSFARRLGLTIPLLIEGDTFPITTAFGVVATPTVFVIDRDGVVTWTTMGFMKPQMNDLGNAVAAALGVTPEPLTTEADADVPMFVPG
ncbi:MAG: TlpA family protein disulfide reductase [Thermomicrobiales bacterium]|nr:TlpA family protein disulfide reductase [Thermomicrobiales bacterium]